MLLVFEMLGEFFGIMGHGKREVMGKEVLEFLDFRGENDEVLLGFAETLGSTAGFVGDLGGSESAWDGGATRPDGGLGDSFAVVKAAEEAVLCVGASGWVDGHIAMFGVCFWGAFAAQISRKVSIAVPSVRRIVKMPLSKQSRFMGVAAGWWRIQKGRGSRFYHDIY